MRKAIVLDPDDIKALIAEKFGVEQKDVIKSQYSYVDPDPQPEGEAEGVFVEESNEENSETEE